MVFVYASVFVFCVFVRACAFIVCFLFVLHVFVHVCVSLCVFARIVFVCVCVCLCVCLCVCVLVSLYVCACVFMIDCVCACVCLYCVFVFCLFVSVCIVLAWKSWINRYVVSPNGWDVEAESQWSNKCMATVPNWVHRSEKRFFYNRLTFTGVGSFLNIIWN